MFDILIRDGQIVDGTGNPWFRGSIGITEENIKVLRGDTSSVQAKRIIDASGYAVCPGFIDTYNTPQ